MNFREGDVLAVSVIVPCYNCENFVEETINSILEQSYTDYEIILIDDCSKDNTFSIIKKYEESYENIRAYKNTRNIGVALTRNTGVDLAKHKYIAFLDADDIWHKDKLRIQMEYIVENKEVDMLATNYQLYDEKLLNKINDCVVPKKITYKTLMYENVIGLSTTLIKKEVFDKFKMSNKYIHEDYELWLKLLKNGYQIHGIEKPLVKYRLLETSRNASKWNSLKGRVLILCKEEKINIFFIGIYTIIYAFKGIIKYKKYK